MSQQNRPPKVAIDGWLNLYKPLHLTSAQLVGKVKRLTNAKKVGHAGTLDPLAEGVLPLAFGEATKTAGYMTNAKKGYEFTLSFGEARSTDDAEGEVVATSDVRPTLQQIQDIIPNFSGKISQIPPNYSAIKKDGKRAYDRARSGEEFELSARNIMIYDLRIIEDSLPDAVSFSVSCSKGTYIRSLARDIAVKLGTVGYVSALKRTRVGNFDSEGAISLDFLEELLHIPRPDGERSLSDVLLPLSTALDDIPALTVDESCATKLRHGMSVAVEDAPEDTEIAVFEGEKLVAIARWNAGALKPKRVFNI
ncbi:MAG: tRNA pseudouridine(55) synthase TruB [Rickettsiales bacterium]|nr:tRNA pseudouridine(55) synthase TruB [Rickettsiales bacterium]